MSVTGEADEDFRSSIELSHALAPYWVEGLVQRKPWLTLKSPPGHPFNLTVAVHGQDVLRVEGASMGAPIAGASVQAAMHTVVVPGLPSHRRPCCISHTHSQALPLPDLGPRPT